MKKKKKEIEQPIKTPFLDTWLGQVVSIIVIVGGIAAGCFIFYSAGRASRSAEISTESQTLNRYHYTHDKTHYILFYTVNGGMSVVNYTLDSLKKEYYLPQTQHIELIPNFNFK